MKKIIFAAAVMVAFFVNNLQAQEMPEKRLAIAPSAELIEQAKVDSMTMEYMEAFASRRHDELMLKIDGKTFWKGRAVEGFFFGATAGASYIPTASAFSWLAGAEVGYSLWWGDFLVTGRIGNLTFNGLTFLAPSAFAEARFNLAHFGANKQHRFYLGARIGYQYTEAMTAIKEEGNTEDGGHYDLEWNSKNMGSGLGYGLVMGWEVRQFMSGNRFGIELAAYTFDKQHAVNGMVDGKPVVSQNTTKQGWQVELTFRYSFQLGKVKKNY